MPKSNILIQRIVFRQMAARSVRFGPIDVTGFNDALKTRHSMFLVELRALGKIRDTIKVADGKQIRSAFRTAADDLG
jgi:hypothetical protein